MPKPITLSVAGSGTAWRFPPPTLFGVRANSWPLVGRIIMLSSSEADGEIHRALRSGASAYVLKSMPQHELLAVIRSVDGGKRHVPTEVAVVLAEHLGEGELTARELEVLTLIRDGYKNKQIADQLRISENTVNFHIKNIVDKLEAKDRTLAVTSAIRRGLIPI